MSSALETFFAEAQELLQALEEGLLKLEAGPDAETVNAVFRAAHTIKGSAGLVGLEPVVRFAHSLETVLDRVRAGQLTLEAAHISRLLEGKDHLRELLTAAEAGQPQVVDASLAAALLALVGAPAGAPASASEGPKPEAAQDQDRFAVSVRFGAGVLRDGMDPLAIVRYLERHGALTKVASTFAGPLDDGFDPERCYFSLSFEYATARPGALDEAFEFVREGSDVRVRPLREAALAAPATAPKAPEPSPEKVAAPTQAVAPAQAAQATRADRFIKVQADKLDALVNLVGELVIAGATSSLLASRTRDVALMESLSTLNQFVEDIRDSALGLRMVPIGDSFARFRRVVRDIAQALGKQIELEVAGGETELDKSMVERLADPLLHLVRNALDHGLETPAERVAAGKPETGKLVLEAFHEAGTVVIEVRDDGRGLSHQRIFKKAVERGLVAADAKLSEEEIIKLVFTPGFSSAEKVTDLSGRGVGMDVVRRNVDDLRGTIDVVSKEGHGTTVRLRLPLTLAIIDGFLVRVGPESFVVPLELVRECIDLMPVLESEANHRLDLRGEAVAFIRLRELFHLNSPKPSRESVLVVKYGESRLGLVVDRLVGASQTVIKPLGPLFANVKGIEGSTILGSGEVALILDVPALLAIAASKPKRAA